MAKSKITRSTGFSLSRDQHNLEATSICKRKESSCDVQQHQIRMVEWGLHILRKWSSLPNGGVSCVPATVWANTPRMVEN